MLASLAMDHFLTFLGRLSLPGESGGSIAVADTRALVSRDRLYAVSFSVPEAPRVVAQRPGNFRAVAATDAVACLGFEQGIELVDPESLEQLGVIPLSALPFDVALAGRLVYATADEVLSIWDVSQPAAPRKVGQCPVELAGNLRIVDRYAYVSADIHGVRIIDVSVPEQPSEVGAFRGVGNPGTVAVFGNHACIADQSGGLVIADFSQPSKPRKCASWDCGIVGDVIVMGSFAVLGVGALVVLDISNPRRPREVESQEIPEWPDTAWAIAAAGPLVLALGREGLSLWRSPLGEDDGT